MLRGHLLVQVAGLCRTMALSGVWFAIAHNASQLPLPIVNPDFQDFESKKYAAWRYSHLHHHWMFPWASKTITAANIFDVATTLCPAVIILYSVCLFCASLQHLVPLSAVQRLPAWLKVNKANRHERQKLRDRLLKEKTLPDEVDGRLKPVVLLRPPPWEGRALLPAMALLVLDVGLDFKTLLDFLVARHYLFAAVMTFIVIRSTLKQFTILAPWKLRQASLLHLLEAHSVLMMSTSFEYLNSTKLHPNSSSPSSHQSSTLALRPSKRLCKIRTCAGDKGQPGTRPAAGGSLALPGCSLAPSGDLYRSL